MKVLRRRYLKNVESNPPILEISKFQKLETQLSGIKSYIRCKISDVTQEIESVKPNFYETIKDIEQRVKNTEILKDHLLFLQSELSFEKEIIKSLMAHCQNHLDETHLDAVRELI